MIAPAPTQLFNSTRLRSPEATNGLKPLITQSLRKKSGDLNWEFKQVSRPQDSEKHCCIAPLHDGSKLSLFTFTPVQQTRGQSNQTMCSSLAVKSNGCLQAGVHKKTHWLSLELLSSLESLWPNMPDFWLTPHIHIEKLPIFWQNIVAPLITCMLPCAELYSLQFCEKQVDIVHRIYLPDKGFCVFQKYLKRTRMLLLLFWVSTLTTRTN